MMSDWQNKTVLIAGGAGFIGRHMVRALLEARASVHVVDDYSTGDQAALATLGAGNQLTLHEHDIARPCALPPADVIFNLASAASPVHYQSDPLQTWKSNILGTLNLLEHAISCGAKLVQASTSEVYGDPLSHPQRETDWGNVNPVGPRACYDESKRAAETLLMDAARDGRADIRIARIFNTYGPGMDQNDGRALPTFIAQAALGEPLSMHGDGSQTRSFCYVSDTVDGLLRLATADAARGEIVNLGNPNEITIRQTAAAVNRVFGPSDQIVVHARPVDDPSRRCPDIAKARQLLEWEPRVSFDDGLRRMIDGFVQPAAPGKIFAEPVRATQSD